MSILTENILSKKIATLEKENLELKKQLAAKVAGKAGQGRVAAEKKVDPVKVSKAQVSKHD